MRLFYDPETKRIGPLLRGHLLLFGRREGPSYAAGAGLRLLIVVLLLELVLGPRMSGLTWVGLTPPPAGLRNAALLVLALASAVLVARVKLTDIGIVSQWRASEVMYLAQVAIVAPAIFLALFGERLGLFGGDTGAWFVVGGLVGANLLWGLYQELIYRGMLQTELSRRFGAVSGALLANLAFTFGPLPFYHLQHAAADPTRTAIMMGAIFGIGLVFAFIFARSRNVLLVGLLHGVGNVFGNVGAAATGPG